MYPINILVRHVPPFYLIVKLANFYGLRAERITAFKCIDVFWNQIQSGACYVQYNVTLKDASGAYLYSSGRYNNRNIRVCDTPTYNRAHYAQLTVSFKNQTSNTTTRITSPSTTASITPSSTSSYGPSVAPPTKAKKASGKENLS